MTTASSQTIDLGEFQDGAASRQRISDLATQLHRKDTDLQQELTKVAAYTKTVKDLRDTVHSLRDELRKHGTCTPSTGVVKPIFQASANKMTTVTSSSKSSAAPSSTPVASISTPKPSDALIKPAFQASVSETTTAASSEDSSATLESTPGPSTSTFSRVTAEVTEQFQADSAPTSARGSPSSSVLPHDVSKRIAPAGTPIIPNAKAVVHKRPAQTLSQPSPKGPTMPRRGRTCSFCSRQNHTAERCWDKINFLRSETTTINASSTSGISSKHAASCQSLTATAQTKPFKNAVCSFCNHRGHIAPKCWDKHPALKPAHVILSSSKSAAKAPNKGHLSSR